MTAVRSYPSLLSAITSHDLSSPGRVYKLLQAIDENKTGLFTIASIKETLCSKRSKYHICSWRWLRKLLDRGEGVFWNRYTDSQLWLRGPKRVALALGIDHLYGRPVYLPIESLLGSIQEVKANFFAAFESGRKNETPISQRTLRNVTGISERTQRTYNQLLERTITKNYTITGLEYNQENVYDLTMQSGRPVLQFVDKRGLRFNDPTAAYCLYRLPDTRSRVHEQAPKGRQRAINKALNLADNLEQGKRAGVDRLYYDSVEAAAKAYGRNPNNPHYWPLKKSALPNARKTGKFEGVGMWGCVI
jgi:hypothetical protein